MQRVTLFAVVEGQSESGFFKPFLAEHLALRGIDLHVAVIGKGSAKGGMFRSFVQVCAELGNFLADRRRPWVTTFFDYYGLPTGEGRGWDFVPAAKARGSVAAAAAIENRLRDGVRDAAPQAVERFIPYIQLHELEALYFAEPVTLATVLETPATADKFAAVVTAAGGCEQINDSPTTAPSKRLQAICPHYIKGRSSAAHAPRLGEKLSLATVREQCPRFHAWLASIEELAPVA